MAVSVLIVEDDRNIAELLQMYLEKEGYAVTIAADGGQGLAKFRAQELQDRHRHHPGGQGTACGGQRQDAAADREVPPEAGGAAAGDPGL